MSAEKPKTDRQPPGWFVALAGGISGGVSALLFDRALFVGLGAGGGVVVFFVLYMGWHRIRGG